MAEIAIMLDEIISDNKLEFELVASLPPKGKTGTIYICNNTEYLFVKNTWEEIGKVENYYTHAEMLELQLQTQEEKLPTNCKNCGAVLKGHVCEYCGSIY